jgi:pimeloyl-ACP methyl ester carboxylesterase
MFTNPAKPGFDAVRLAAAGIELHAMRGGAGEPPLLLLHGFPDHWQVWHRIMPRLAQRHVVLAPDLRGINLSDKPQLQDDYRIDALVADVRSLIASLGGRVGLVGHDWGGMLAWVVAARHPELVSHLVVLNAPHPCRFAEQLRDDPAQRAASQYALALIAPQAEGRLAADQFAALWAVLVNSVPGLPADERELHVAAWSQPGALHAMLNWYRALDVERAFAPGGVRALPDLGNASGQIEAPTLVLWGERDGAFPIACLDGLERWVPRLTLRRFPGVDHWPQLERPAEVAEAILDFVARH